MRRKSLKRGNDQTAAATNAAPMTLQPPILVRMTVEQQQEALTALVELLLPRLESVRAEWAA
jgi:hypothetical protein